VKSVAVSVVLNQAALGKLSTDQIKQAIAGAFAYPVVTVTVTAAAFQAASVTPASSAMLAATGPVSHALLELLAAAGLLFGLAIPFGRSLASVSFKSLIPPAEEAAVAGAAGAAPRQITMAVPMRDFTELREQAGDNIAGVARLLQSWVEDAE
jgi:flagellar M-ring protein FliF